MSIFGQISTFFQTDLRRYLRSPALWFVALAAPIAAHYIVPDISADYAVISVNNMIPVRSASVLGLELGVIAATLLTPLAYIFLRVGPTRRQPWQVTDVTPHSLAMAALGRWMADTATLWLILVALTLAGLVLGIFRLDGRADVFQTIAALWLPAAPAMALVAAIRMIVDSQNLTRRWLGDVIFFILWIGLMITGIIGASDPVTGAMINQPATDAFGFTAPIIGSVNDPVTAVTIGGAPSSGERFAIDAWQGVSNPSYVMSRFGWLSASALIAIVAGLIWSPMKSRPIRVKKGAAKERSVSIAKRDLQSIPFKAPTFIAPKNNTIMQLTISEIQLILRSWNWTTILLVVALSGLVLPFRTIAGPAILLALIFPLTEASARWQNKSLEQLVATMGVARWQRIATSWLGAALIAAVALLPSTLKLIISGEFQWLPQIGLIAAVVPAIIVGLGAITRSPIAGRLIMLMIWYVYLSSAAPA